MRESSRPVEDVKSVLRGVQRQATRMVKVRRLGGMRWFARRFVHITAATFAHGSHARRVEAASHYVPFGVGTLSGKKMNSAQRAQISAAYACDAIANAMVASGIVSANGRRIIQRLLSLRCATGA